MIGRPPISTIGLGIDSVNSDKREPNPPANMTVFIIIRFEEPSPKKREILRSGNGRQILAAGYQTAHLT